FSRDWSSDVCSSDLADRGERDADALGGPYEGHPAQGVAAEPALVARGPAAGDQTFGLVEVQGGDGRAAAGGELADRELVDLLWNLGHSPNPTHRPAARVR